MATGQKGEFKLELKRKLFHLIVGLTVAFLTFILEPVYGKLILVPLYAGIIALFILQHFRKNPLSIFMTNHLERHKEAPILYKGAMYYGIGASIPILFLDRLTACAIIAILAVGDAAATLIGKFYGKRRPRGMVKSIEGTLSFIVFSVPVAYLFLPNLDTVVVLAIAGSIVELFSPFDDNLAIPIILTALAVIMQILL